MQTTRNKRHLSLPETFGTRQFKKLLGDEVSRLSAEQLPPDAVETWDAAGKTIAGHFGMPLGEISWRAHRTDFIRLRKEKWLDFWKEAADSIAQPVLPGFEIKCPTAVMIDDERVSINDARCTVQVLIDQQERAVAALQQQADAMRIHAEKLSDAADVLKANLAEWRKLAESRPFGLSADQLVVRNGKVTPK